MKCLALLLCAALQAADKPKAVPQLTDAEQLKISRAEAPALKAQHALSDFVKQAEAQLEANQTFQKLKADAEATSRAYSAAIDEAVNKHKEDCKGCKVDAETLRLVTPEEEKERRAKSEAAAKPKINN